ncbi:MAG: GNAT family N-acetyltransferase [Hyphomicrobiales bacterium]
MELATARLRLRRPTRAEAEALAAGTPLASTRCLDGYPTPDTFDAFAPYLDGRRPEPPWLIVRAADGFAIGDIGLAPRDRPEVATGGYGLATAAWNQGYATEALIALIDYTWRTFPEVTRIELDALPGNIASRRVMEKAGLQLHHEDHELALYVLHRPC